MCGGTQRAAGREYIVCIIDFIGKPLVDVIDWYENRVIGSPGTKTALPGISAGLTISERGFLCVISLGQAMRFVTESDAGDYLAHNRTADKHDFETVRCTGPRPELPLH